MVFPCWKSESCPRRSASHETGTPQVERAFLVRPGTLLDRVGYDLELGRDLDEIALRVLYHEEKIVARSMSPRPPPQLDAPRRQVIGPVADIVPAIRLIGVVVLAALRRAEHAEAVMLGLAAVEGGGGRAVSIGGVDVVGRDEAERMLIKAHQCR